MSSVSNHKPAVEGLTSSVPSSEVLTSLLLRIEAAKHADAVIDFDIWCAFNNERDTLEKWRHEIAKWDDAERIHWASRFTGMKNYTSSIDDALELVTRDYPDRVWCVSKRSEAYFGWGLYRASIDIQDDANSLLDAIGHGSGPALALCAALLKARLADEGTKTPSPSEAALEQNPSQQLKREER